MKMRIPILSLWVFTASLSGGLTASTQEPAPPAAAKPADSKSNAEKLGALLQEAYSLQTRKRYIDSLAKLAEAETLSPDNAEIYNLRGSIFLGVQLRDIEKARADFKKAMDLSPGAVPPLFNMAELEFVSGNFAEAEKGFRALVDKFDRLPQSMRHLLRFKIIVSMAKQSKLAEAEEELKTNFTFMDDTPAYYFARAVLALEAKREKEGNEWLTKGQIIFKKPDTAAYVDSLMETRYIHSIDIPDAESADSAPVKAAPTSAP
jgi:tetratricopeptide (TPR) repeat protein